MMSIWLDPLAIDGTALPDQAQFGMQIRIEPIGGVARHRLSGGGLVQQTNWRKRRLTISAQGWVPSELDAIDWSLPHAFTGQTITGTFSGLSDGPQFNNSPQSADFGWSLTVEES